MCNNFSITMTRNVKQNTFCFKMNKFQIKIVVSLMNCGSWLRHSSFSFLKGFRRYWKSRQLQFRTQKWKFCDVWRWR
jgi:hypothetical protein